MIDREVDLAAVEHFVDFHLLQLAERRGCEVVPDHRIDLGSDNLSRRHLVCAGGIG